MELVDNRSRALGIAGAVIVHGVVIAGILLLAPRYSAPQDETVPGLVAVPISEPTPPPPPPPPDDVDEGAPAPESRGADEAPAPPPPPAPIARPSPAEVAVDPGSASGAGAGAAPGNAAGQGGEGSGSGAGGEGAGRGAGIVTPPVRIAGALSDRDYERSGLPRGAGGTVVIGFRVRADGSVDRCQIVSSSGYEAIDRTTCRLVEQRFRFRPARDQAGRAIDFDLRTDFTWRPRR